jgi:hypothetical protein
VTGTVLYERLTLSPAGLGALVTKPARFVDVELRVQGGGACYGASSTDATGAYAINTTAPSGATLEVAVFSRTDGDPLRNVTVHDALPPGSNSHTNSNCFTAVSASLAAGSVANRDVTVPYNPGNPSSRPSIGFAVLDVLVTCVEAVRLATGEVPPLCHGYTRLGNAGATGTSFYDHNARALTILGGASGNLDNSDTDYFDDGVIAHEIHHFIEFNMGHALNRGGPHGGKDIEPPFAWSEGASTGFGCVLRNDPLYIDTVRTSPFPPQINASVENWLPQPVRDIGSEETVSEIVWDLVDGANGIADVDGDVAALLLTDLYPQYISFSPATDAPYVGTLLDRLVDGGFISAVAMNTLLGSPENQQIAYPLAGGDLWPVPIGPLDTVGGTCDWRTDISVRIRPASVWYRFTLASTTVVTFDLTITPTSAGGGDMGDNLDLYLLALSGAVYDQSLNGGASAEQVGPILLDPGDYLVRVEANPGHHADFTLSGN